MRPGRSSATNGKRRCAEREQARPHVEHQRGAARAPGDYKGTTSSTTRQPSPRNRVAGRFTMPPPFTRRRQSVSDERTPPGLLRLPAILKLIPVSRSTWWAGVRAGRFPQPIKLGPRITAWRAEDIAALIGRTRAQEGRS
ncbi:helix-turn-helix transcriptional regulator [Hyalangium versicolor]|uniref:helix-turn-helix transcriptional regulator n=1 Tax=Hyalangium versicolor TaxID=2861190 RepID=UPI0035A0B3DE